MSQAGGATPEEWDAVLRQGLRGHIVPIVTDTNVPLSLNTNRKQPAVIQGGRAVGIARWQSFDASEAQITAYRNDSRMGFGIQTKYVRGIDVDVPHAQAYEIRKFLKDKIPDAPIRGRANSQKFLMAVCVVGTRKKATITVENGKIELLGEGNQFVAAGQHESGARYEWEGDFGKIPLIRPEEYDAIIEEIQDRFSVAPTKVDTSRTNSERFLENIQRDPIATRLQDEGYVLGNDSAKGYLYVTCPWLEEHTTDGGSSSTVYMLANYAGEPEPQFKCLHAHCHGRGYRDLAQVLRFDELAHAFDDLFGASNTEGVRAWKRLELRPYSAGMRSPIPPWLIRHVLPAGDVGVAYGPPGSGKSFLLFDMAIRITQGLPWMSKKTKRGAVVYISSEGEDDFNLRRLANRIRMGVDDAHFDEHFFFIPGRMDLQNKEDWKLILEQIKALGVDVVLIVIDTMAANMNGADENDNAMLEKILGMARWFARKLKTLIVLSHHTTKSGDSYRGGSAIEGAADFLMRVDKPAEPGGNRKVTIVKQRGGAVGDSYEFRLEKIVVGLDMEGELVDTCVVSYPSYLDDPMPRYDGSFDDLFL